MFVAVEYGVEYNIGHHKECNPHVMFDDCHAGFEDFSTVRTLSQVVDQVVGPCANPITMC